MTRNFGEHTGITGDGLSEYIEEDKAKRRLDVAISLATLGPAITAGVPIAAAIKLDSPGPIFVKVDRKAGADGDIFQMRKFRSLPADFEGPDEIYPGDSRITRIGRLLRRPGLDELPQALHVLRGDMTMVGVRALQPNVVDRMMDQAPDKGLAEYWSELTAASKPAVTGPSANESHRLRPCDAMVTDIQYLERATLHTDIRQIGRTAMLPIDVLRSKFRS